MKSNNLFIDEEYQKDCSRKINLYDEVKSSTTTIPNELIYKDNKPAQNFSKKIGENLYKKL